MTQPTPSSSELFPADRAVLDLLRERDAQTVAELAESLGLTLNAVRRPVTRLLALGFIAGEVDRTGWGRPSKRFSLTAEGRRQTGNNFADLATVMWQELRAIEDPAVRRGLLVRLASRMAEMYSREIEGETPAERMKSLAELFSRRQMPFEISPAEATEAAGETSSSELPVLRALACPYPDLAEMDRTVCAMERLMFGELVGESLRLDTCRLDGDTCCTFAPAAAQ